MISNRQRLDRMKGIGGSDMPIILGISNYKTPFQLYLEKKGLLNITKPETPEQYWGHRLEPVIRKEFLKRHKVKVELPGTLIYPFHTFMRGNLDGFIPEWNAVLEIKMSNQFMASSWGASGSDIIPLAYLAQVIHYCCVSNADCAYIVVLIGGNDYREFKYIRDFELENIIIDAGINFWNAVQNGHAPAPVNKIDLKYLYPQNKPGKAKIIAPVNIEQLTYLNTISSQIKTLESTQEKLRFDIMKYMEDAECLLDKSGRPLATWKSNKNGTRTFLLKGA